MFENPILITISAAALFATPFASVLASVLTYQSDERPKVPMPVDEFEKTKQSPLAPLFLGLGVSYAICAIASFISLMVLSYVLLVLPIASSIIGALFARLLSKTKSASLSRAIFAGCIAGYIGMVASVMLGSLGLNGHL